MARHNGVPPQVTANILPGQTEALERVIVALELQLKESSAAMLEVKTQVTVQTEQLNIQGHMMQKLEETMLTTQTELRMFANHQRKLQDYQHELYLNSNRL